MDSMDSETFTENTTAIGLLGVNYSRSAIKDKGQHIDLWSNNSQTDSWMEIALRRPVRAINENSKVGWLLSSKALVQLMVNPIVGLLSYR